MCPTYGLIRDIFYPLMYEILEETGIGFKINKAEANVIFDNGSVIHCRTMDAPERIIGISVGDAVLDEIDTMPYDKAIESWRKAQSRLRQKFPDGKVNSIYCITTPENFSFSYEMFVKNKPTEYELIRASTYDNPYLPDGYIDGLIATYPKEYIQAYLMGIHVNLQGNTVYSSFDRNSQICTTDRVLTQSEKTIHIGMDFNVGKSFATILIYEGDILYAVGEHHSVLDTPEMITIFGEQYPDKTKIIYPDASGASRKSQDASKSDISLLREIGTINAPAKNGRIKDRIMSVNKALETGKLVINVEKCPELVATLEQQIYDNNGLPKKDDILDHGGDSVGYACVRLMPIAGAGKVSVQSINMW